MFWQSKSWRALHDGDDKWQKLSKNVVVKVLLMLETNVIETSTLHLTLRRPAKLCKVLQCGRYSLTLHHWNSTLSHVVKNSRVESSESHIYNGYVGVLASPSNTSLFFRSRIVSPSSPVNSGLVPPTPPESWRLSRPIAYILPWSLVGFAGNIPGLKAVMKGMPFWWMNTYIWKQQKNMSDI